MNVKLFQGDCLNELRRIERNSVDSLVTDPPAGISFMGKDWDGDKGGRKQWIEWMAEVMRECLRVMKPGAHGLVWALPRTSRWTATALEDAGFEVRDVVTHLFGSGFPKSLDVSKAIDKAAGAERMRVPIIDVSTGKAKSADIKGGMFKPCEKFEAYSNEGITDAAKQWQGFGTALKPASEHWILIRKPCSEKTVAANVLKWGTGALNIDASRIGNGGESSGVRKGEPSAKTCYAHRGATNFAATPGPRGGSAQGRFPANLVLSHTPRCTDAICDIECAITALDRQSLAGGMHAAGKARDKGAFSKSGMFSSAETGAGHRVGNSGGASRFFYCAKISKSERNAGLDGMPKVSKSQLASKDGGGGGWAKDADKNPNLPRANHHPTVKPKRLMTYLIRMVTPPGGVVLDPFTGSGSTGVASVENEFNFTGIEREKEYFGIARKRIDHARGGFL